jgi:heat shock protein HtpX
MIWEQIRSNRTRSFILVILMGIVLLLLGYFLGLYFFDSEIAGMLTALLIWVIMTLIAYFQGDSILLSISRARKIGPEDHPRLYNVVEEMKISSGLEEMPSVYIIDDPAMNAFATGRDPQRASVAVTSGLLQKLNRDELQGVIGHELSHINNRDVLLMSICGVMLGTIVMLSYYASRMMMFGGMGRTRRSSSSGGGGGQIIVLLIALVLRILAPIMAQLIYFAISRRREYLADACSAQYTRYPEGLASALEKLSMSHEQLKSANKATAPMFIVNPFRSQGLSASDITSTHPPISERVHILRSMSGASFRDYDAAYKAVRKSSAGLPKSTMLAGDTVPIRAASSLAGDEPPGEIARARETTDVLWNANSYRKVNCECGTKFRIPPGFGSKEFICPHCGRLNQVR